MHTLYIKRTKFKFKLFKFVDDFITKIIPYLIYYQLERRIYYQLEAMQLHLDEVLSISLFRNYVMKIKWPR